MFFGWVNVGKKGIHEACAQLQGRQRGRQNQAAFTPEALPSDDFQSQVGQPLLYNFDFGSLMLVAVYLCVLICSQSTQVKVLKLNPPTLTQQSRYHTQDFAERESVLQHEWIWNALYAQQHIHGRPGQICNGICKGILL